MKKAIELLKEDLTRLRMDRDARKEEAETIEKRIRTLRNDLIEIEGSIAGLEEAIDLLERGESSEENEESKNEGSKKGRKKAAQKEGIQV